ncbi:methyl-accepting chemotaxis protein [Fluviispira vulneris]|uniref:methyl-accepting chemotaxis protein n=1 Tax=Fluviispira vulneris TaxID=2763012 RepID=UPI001646AB1A|nr:methyl-accepting chemotaxis protein [Fluviispira vulneris]
MALEKINKLLDRFSLKAKVIFTGIFGITIIAFIIITIALINNNIRNQEAIQNYINKSTYAIDKSISAQFYERYGDVQAFAVNTILQTNRTDDMAKVFNEYVRMYGIYDFILFVDANGNYVASNTKGSKDEKLNLAKLSKQNFAKTEWFKNSFEERYTVDKTNGFDGTFFEDAQTDSLVEEAYGRQEFTTSFSTVVKNSAGKKIGVITNRANFAWVGSEISTEFEQARKYSAIRLDILLLNKNGALLADFTRESFEKGKALDPNYSSEKAKMLIDSDAVKDALNNKSGSSYFYDKISKRDTYLAFDQIKNKKFIPSINWTLVISIPVDDIFGGNNRQTLYTVIIISSVWLISLIFALYLSLGLSKKFAEVARRLGITSESILKSSKELTKLFDKVAANAVKQSQSQEQSSASLTQILAMINRTVENVQSSKVTATNVSNEAQEGNQAMERMEKAVIKIEETNTSLEEIRKIINQINTKTSLINDIVSKTELLSLNASIEAARAGEYGKGFAVVAEEVGNLAKTSGNAANEIETLIASSASKVDSIIEETKLKVVEGIEASKLAVTIFKGISEKIEDIKQRVDSINEATNEQKIGVETTTEATNQLSLVTKENSDSADKALATAKTVEQDSNRIALSMNEIKYLVYGKRF